MRKRNAEPRQRRDARCSTSPLKRINVKLGISRDFRGDEYLKPYVVQGSPSGGRRMPPGGDASRKELRLDQKK